ncbi:MAG: group III truncated hemoglobin [Candidatus Melainabacteria bacterium]|nr:group III truncated hemoglobin [Candidatus Melainabacteria bacterium]
MPSLDECQLAQANDAKSLGDSLGITQDEIQSIIRRFYEKVQYDSSLGPVFAREISNDWNHHLETMGIFWASVMFGKSLYVGNPIEIHRRIAGLSTSHFDHWLELFRDTLIEVCPNNEHVGAFYNRACSMAKVMKTTLLLKKKTPE